MEEKLKIKSSKLCPFKIHSKFIHQNNVHNTKSKSFKKKKDNKKNVVEIGDKNLITKNCHKNEQNSKMSSHHKKLIGLNIKQYARKTTHCVQSATLSV